MKLSNLLVCALLLFNLLTTSTDACIHPELVKFVYISGKCIVTNAGSGAVLGILTLTGFGPFLLNTATCTGIGYLQYTKSQGSVAFIKDVGYDIATSVFFGGLLNTKNIQLLSLGSKKPTALTMVTNKLGKFVSSQTAKKLSDWGLKNSGIVISTTQKTYSAPVINAAADSLFSNNVRKLIIH